MMKSGIYSITNKVNNKLYIGSATNVKFRFSTHKCKLRKGIHGNKHLQASWNKYTEENFDFNILQLCDKKELVKYEQFWIDWSKCYERGKGYNLRKLANSNFGYKHSEETNAKQSLLRKGRKQSEETKLKRSLALKGRQLSEENKRNIGLANKGRKVSNKSKATTEAKLNMINGWKIRKEKFFKQLIAVPIILTI